MVRYVASWIDQRERQTERAHLTILFEKYVPRCLEQMRNTFKTITPIPDISVVQVHKTHACSVNVWLCSKKVIIKIIFFTFRHSALCWTAFCYQRIFHVTRHASFMKPTSLLPASGLLVGHCIKIRYHFNLMQVDELDYIQIIYI